MLLSFALALSLDLTPVLVETSEQVSFDGMTVTDDGTLYLCGGWRGDGLFRVDPGGEVTLLATGFQGPTDPTVGPDGSVYVSNYNGTTVSRITPEREHEVFATVGQGPTGLDFDSAGNLYVAVFGAGYGTDDRVMKVTPSGEVSVHAEGGGLWGVIGLGVDAEDRVVAANWRDGRIFRIEHDGTPKLVATVPVGENRMTIGHLDVGGGRIFASGSHSLYAIDESGAIEIVVENGVARRAGGPPAWDGLVKPNGLCVTSDGTRLFASVDGADGNRRIARFDLPARDPRALAAAATASGRFDVAVRLMKEQVAASPNDAGAWMELGGARYWQGEFEKGAAAFARAASAPALAALAQFNRACCLTRLGNADDAFEALFAAVDAGFRDVGTLRGVDDLAPLRDDARFAGLVRDLQAGI